MLDAEKRRKHDEDLIDSGVRNENALPLLCSICMDHSNLGAYARKCLKGFGHKSPLIEDFHTAQREYSSWRRKNRHGRNGKAEFANTLERVLQEFIKSEWLRLYPLAGVKPQSRDQGTSNEDSPLPKFVTEALKGGLLFVANEKCQEKEQSSVLSSFDVVELFYASLVRTTKHREGDSAIFNQECPMYDLSSLSDRELMLIHDYLRLPGEPSTTREILEDKVTFYFPNVDAVPEVDKQPPNASRICERCSARLSFVRFVFTSSSSLVCFSCNKVCCQSCMHEKKCKVTSSGSFTLRQICKECFTEMKTRAAQLWLEHGRCLLEADKKKLETVLAMYMISNAINPSEKSVIYQAQALHDNQEYERLVNFGVGVLPNGELTIFTVQKLVYLVADSLVRIADNTDKIDLMRKANMYEQAVEWIENSTELFVIANYDSRIHELKLKATRMRLSCLQEHDEITQNTASRIFSQLIEAIREASFLKALVILQNENSHVMRSCFEKLLAVTPDNYNEYSRLLLRLLKANAKRAQGYSTGAINEVADVFWNGYTLFKAHMNDVPIVDYVIQFTMGLLREGGSLPLERVGQIGVHNFLSTLQLTEKDLINPPDIDQRKWENLNVNGCDMKMFLKYEAAVKRLVRTKKWSPIDAAFAYYDLLSACRHPAQLLITLTTSAQWFARQMSHSDCKESSLFACNKMITRITNLAAALAFEFTTHPYMQYYVAKLVIGLQFYSSWKTGYGGEEAANFIGVHMRWLVAAGRHCPLHKVPIVTPTEAVLMNLISAKLHCDYLLQLQDNIPQELRPMSEAILRYQIYENCWFKRGEVDNPRDDGLRLTAMTELLAEEKWSWDDVQRRLLSNMIALDRNGWQLVNGKLLGSVSSSNIQRLVGLEISKKDFSVSILVERASRFNVFSRKPALLSWDDIGCGLSLSDPGSFFSLEGIDPQQTRYHPFNKAIFFPEQLDGSDFLFTMLHTDYLLKQFSMGCEIQSRPPFELRSISEGLLKGVPSKLKQALSSIPSRGASRSKVHRFWIQADSMEFDVQEDNDTICWLFGEVNIEVRCMPMFHGEDGELKDLATDGPEPNSPEGRFVADFNKNYEEIGKQFPEFLRLKELSKVQWLGRFLESFKDSLEQQQKKVESGELDSELRRVQSLARQEAECSIASQLDNIRSDIRRQVTYINESVVSQVHRQGSISAPYDEISNWLYSGSSYSIAQRIAREKTPTLNEIRTKILEQHKANLKKYMKTLADLKKASTKLNSSDNKCKWIPSVNQYKEEDEIIRFHYGGVSLMPKAVKKSISKPGVFSGCNKVLLAPNVFICNTRAKQPLVQAFNPPKVNATKSSGDERSRPPNSNSGTGSNKGGKHYFYERQEVMFSTLFFRLSVCQQHISKKESKQIFRRPLVTCFSKSGR